MSGEAAAAVERLPWLAEEAPGVVERPRRGNPMLWLAPLLLLAGAGAFWMLRDSAENGANLSNPRGNSTVTVRLPDAVAVEPVAVEVKATPVREKPQIVPREVAEAPKIEPKPVEKRVTAPPPAVKTAIPKPKKASLPPAPAGRLIRIGAFGSSEQAKDARLTVLKTYPAIAQLTNGVAPARNSKGREYYRFQLRTTSQAHSEVLCQRMQKIGLSCTVVGLPEKAKATR